MTWIILRTEHRKEAYVATQVERLGFEAWVPVQIVACRPAIARRITSKTALKAYREICLLPRRVFASVPVNEVGELAQIRHFAGVEQALADGRFLLISDRQIEAFRSEIDRENTAALALASRPSKRQKAKWRSLHEALVEMIEDAKQRLEMAA